MRISKPQLALGLADWRTHTRIRTLRGHANGASLAISPDGRLMASGGLNGLVKVWNISRYTRGPATKAPAATGNQAIPQDLRPVAAKIFAEGKAVFIWDGEAGKPLKFAPNFPIALRTVKYAFGPGKTPVEFSARSGVVRRNRDGTFTETVTIRPGPKAPARSGTLRVVVSGASGTELSGAISGSGLSFKGKSFARIVIVPKDAKASDKNTTALSNETVVPVWAGFGDAPKPPAPAKTKPKLTPPEIAPDNAGVRKTPGHPKDVKTGSRVTKRPWTLTAAVPKGYKMAQHRKHNDVETWVLAGSKAGDLTDTILVVRTKTTPTTKELVVATKLCVTVSEYATGLPVGSGKVPASTRVSCNMSSTWTTMTIGDGPGGPVRITGTRGSSRVNATVIAFTCVVRNGNPYLVIIAGASSPKRFGTVKRYAMAVAKELNAQGN